MNASRQPVVLVILPCLAAVLFHLPALFSGFVWDDRALVMTHPRLADPSFARDIFQRDYGLELAARTPVGYYRPLLMLVNLALYQAFGPHPLAYHLFSLLLLCLSAVLVARLCWLLTDKRSLLLPVLAGGLYAAHPARTEVVSLFMSAPDLILECLGLAFLLLVAKAVRQAPVSSRRRSAPLFLAVILALAAGLTKESAFLVFSALGATLIVSGVMLGRFSRSLRPAEGGIGNASPSPAPLLLIAVALFIGLAVALALTHSAQIQRPSAFLYVKALFGQGSGPAASGALLSAASLLFPSYPVFMSQAAFPSSWLSAAGIALLLATLSALVIRFLVRRRIPEALLLAWFSASLVNVMLTRSVFLPFSQRYLSVAPAMVGLVLLADHYGPILKEKIPSAVGRHLTRPVLISLGSFYVLAHGWFTGIGSYQCTDQQLFFTFMATEQPSLAYPRIALAHILFNERGNLEKAEAWARDAIRLAADDPETRQLGLLLARKNIQEKHLAAAAQWADWTLEKLPNCGEAWFLKALANALMDDPASAEKAIRKAVDLEQDNREYLDLSRQITEHLK